MKLIGTTLTVIILVPAILVAACLVNGWVLVTLWQWFIPSIAPELPPLRIPVAVGIALIAHLLTHQDMSNIEKKKERRPLEDLAGIFMVPLFTLALGWIVHQFV